MTFEHDLLGAIGGAANVGALTHCWARLRFALRDPAALDLERVRSLPGVAYAAEQYGELHVAPRTGLMTSYEILTSVIAAESPR